MNIHRYPGSDYRNPAPGLFKPLRVPQQKDPNNPDEDDDELIEIEIAVPGEQLPTAAIAAIGADEDPYEVEVVTDFSVAVMDYPLLTASTVTAHASQGNSMSQGTSGYNNSNSNNHLGESNL